MKCYYCIVINYTAKCTFLEVQGTGLFHSPGEPLALQLVGGLSYLSQTRQGAQPQAGTVPHVAQRRWDEILCQGAWIITKDLVQSEFKHTQFFQDTHEFGTEFLTKGSNS